jgi:hypothetical protein
MAAGVLLPVRFQNAPAKGETEGEVAIDRRQATTAKRLR